MMVIRLREEESTEGSRALLEGDVPAHHAPFSRLDEKEEKTEWTLVVHRSLGGLETLEPAWRGLTFEEASPFQTYSWNLAWYQHFAAAVGVPLIFETKKDGITVAILPCYFAGRKIRLAGDRTCDYQDIISMDADAVATSLAMAMDWVKREAARSHFHFEKLSSEGLLFQVLYGSADSPEGTLRFEKSYAPCPFVDLKGGLDDYLVSLPRKIRQDLRHSLNRLEREVPSARVSKLSDFQIRVDDLANAARFHIEHFRKKGASPFRDKRLVSFFGQVAKDPDVGLQLAFLANEGTLLAVDFGFVRGGRYYGYLTAFDRAYGRLSPGKCLLLKRIDSWVIEDAVHTLDFLAGDESYKKNFTGGSAYRVWSMRLMPCDLRNHLRRLGLESNKTVRSFVKRAIGKLARRSAVSNAK